MTAYNAAVDLLERNDPDRLAVIDDEGRYSYGEVAWHVARVAGALAALGVQPEHETETERRSGRCAAASTR